MLDAYCPHMGANLGAGGQVKGDCIECPFHGWQFRGEDGQCVHIPYVDKGLYREGETIRVICFISRVAIQRGGWAVRAHTICRQRFVPRRGDYTCNMFYFTGGNSEGRMGSVCTYLMSTKVCTENGETIRVICFISSIVKPDVPTWAPTDNICSIKRVFVMLRYTTIADR